MLSEFSLIKRYFKRPTPQALLGPGDDCALVLAAPDTTLAVTSDMLVSGTHFLANTDPYRLGWKSLAVNLSDLAAMGAKPRWFTLALSLPQVDEDWLAAFAEGLLACADAYAIDLVGGDTTRGALNICITAMGELPLGQALRRDGAQENDDIWVSGTPGRAALGLAHLLGEIILPPHWLNTCQEALEKPTPRLGLGLALRQKMFANAAIDVSDGLLADLNHIAQSSQLRAELCLHELPPLPQGVEEVRAREAQLAGGDDYELVFTAASAYRAEIAALSPTLNLPLTRIGAMRRLPGESREFTVLLDQNGASVPQQKRGFDHFA